MKIYISLVSILLTLSLNAQNCTSCTVTISTFNSTPQVVPAGTTLCVASGAELSGNLVISGGTVCNEGTISSPNIAMSSGVINNYGVIFSPKLGVTGGNITNYNLGVVTVDSIGISVNGSVITNNHEWTSKYIGLTSLGGTQPVWNNSGSLFTDSIGVTNWTMNLSGTFVANYDFGFNVNSVINNSGLFDVWRDFGNDASSTFNNSDQATIGRDFGNVGTVYNTCTIDVGRDFANSGTVTGPTTSCGKISVAQVSANSGSFGADGSNIDLCDATGNGFDGNIGTIGNNVTNCACTAGCAPLNIQQNVLNNVSVFPNPFRDFTTFELQSEGKYQIQIYNLNGKSIFIDSFTSSNYKLISKEFKSGIYFYRISPENGTDAVGKLIVK